MKNKTLIKFLSAFLAVAMVIGSAPLSGFVGLKLPDWLDFSKIFGVEAEAATYSGTCGATIYDDVKWTLDTETGVLSITGTGRMVDFPSTSSNPWGSRFSSHTKSVVVSDGVLNIGSYAFSGCANLESITIPDSVTSIGNSAFYGCTSLTSVTIPDSVTSIGSHAFYNCDRLTSIVIPDSVTSIGDSAFAACDSLTSVTIPDSVTSIGSSAFYGTAYYNNPENWENDALYIDNCLILIKDTNSGAYIIKEGTKIIADYAVYNCHRITSILLPGSVRSIGKHAFANCSGMESVYYTGDIASWCNISFADEFSSPMVYASSLYLDNQLLSGSLIIPDSVTEIKDYAFAYCDSLTSVTIPDSVTSIGSYAFAYCDKLTSVTIGDSVKSIGDGAFSYCNSLTSITIPDSVTSIGNHAFNVCTSLKSMVIGKGVESLDVDTIVSLTSITSFTVDENNKFYSSDKYGVLYNKDKTELIRYPSKNKRSAFIISDSVTSIGSYAFAYCDSLTSVTISDSVTSIGSGAFYSCDSLTSVTIPDSVTSIGSVAFAHCDSLTSVTIPDSVTSIGSSAFYICDSLTSVTIGDSVTSIGSDAFSNCLYIKSVYYTGNIEDWCNIDFANGLSTPNYYADDFFINNVLQEDIVIPDTISEIKQYTFYGLNCLKSVTIPNTVLDIRYSAFGNCGNLSDVYYTGSENEWLMTSIEDGNNYLKNATVHYLNMTDGDVRNRTVTFVQGSGDNKVTGKVDVSFIQNWFKGDSLNYNHDIARLCSQFVMLGYDNKKKDDTFSTMYQYTKPNLKNALETIGMSGIEILPDAGKDHVNYFIANRKITVDSKEYDLIFVGLIGSYHEQWYSNFDPGTGEIHQGFLSAKESVKVQLEHYIEDYGFSKDTTKILITGHSRGAAASNLLAADLIKTENFASKENIYTYAFATPNSTRDEEERTKPEYDRIYNIVNPEDFVTKCMPVSWGYGRYGQTFVLPSKSNEKNSDYKVYKSNMQKYFSYFTDGKTYLPYMFAEADTRSVVMALTSAVHNVNQFYNKPLLAGVVPMSAHMFFQNSLCHFVSNVASTGDKAAAVSIILGVLGYATSSLAYREIVDYFLLNGTELNPRFEHAHMAETYCAYMMSMTESQLKEERKGYLNTVNCPVDVTVIDNETGEVVGKIVNNVIDEEIAAKENSVVMTVDGDSKSFWLPSDGDYEVILTGNDNGTMDYTVSKIDSDIGEVERVNFYDVEIVDGKSYTGEIISEDFVIEEYTITTDDNGVVSPDENLSDDGLQTLYIDISVVGDGYATESMTVTKGDYVSLSAVAEETGGFIGWYENGELVSTEETYSFVAKENKEITAEFMEIPCEMSGSISAADGATVTLRLLKDSEEVLTISPTDGVYNLKGVEDGTYTLEVSAENHATREYTVTIGDETVNLDVQLNLIGDINGDGNISIIDYNTVLRHVKKISTIDGYAFACADVDGNGKLTVVDYNRILRHVKKTDTLW